MTHYILKRLALIIPTLLGIMILNFVVVQAAPGGPVEKMLARIKGQEVEATARFSGSGATDFGATGQQMQQQATQNSIYRGAQGIDPEIIIEIEKMYGFDKPPTERFWQMLKSYATFDFGTSFFRDVSVIGLIIEKMPVSVSLGFGPPC